MSGQPQVRPDPALELLEVYDAALPHVHGYLLSRCRDRMLAQDLTAETFLAAVTAARQQPAPPITTGWLIGVARHKL
ncbi:MAG TPA: sigma factor, partial [Pseudonocardiaceae bacterium]|nr:sigma factor [Pseudonocardiaceae bacterium]